LIEPPPSPPDPPRGSPERLKSSSSRAFDFVMGSAAAPFTYAREVQHTKGAATGDPPP